MTALADTSGTIVERFVYTPYGDSVALEGDFSADMDGKSDFDWEYRFTSREHDSETDLYYFRARYWHPTLGRFIGRDPIGQRGTVLETDSGIQPAQVSVAGRSLERNKPRFNFDYVDGMNLYAAYFVPNGVDPSGLDWLDCMVQCMNDTLLSNQIAAGATGMVGLGGISVGKEIVLPGQKSKQSILTWIGQKTGAASYKVTSMAGKACGRVFLVIGVADAGIEVYCAAKCTAE